MSSKGERLGVRLFLYVADHHLLIAVIGIFMVLLEGVHLADTNIRARLYVAAFQAAATEGHGFVVFAENPSFHDEEVLLLRQEELHSIVDSWNRFSSSRFDLQAIGRRDHLLYNSRTNRIQRSSPIPFRGHPLLNFITANDPVRFAERELTKDWLFRTTIDRRDYAVAVGKELLSTALPASAIVFLLSLLPRYYRNSIAGRRHFETLINIVLTDPSTLKNEEDLIVHLPAYVRAILEFDSVAVYWSSADVMTLRAVDSVDHVDVVAVRDSSQKSILMLASHAWEAQALSEGRQLRAKRHGWRRDVHVDELGGSREAAYIVTPIFDTRKRRVVGLLTAERLREMEPRDEDALMNFARLVMILIETAQSNVEMERDLRDMITLTRKTALGTIVPVLTHNLNTPLSMVSMVTRDLVENWPEGGDDQVKTALMQIETQMTQCLSIVKTITDYRRIGAPFGPSANMQVSDLNDVLEKIFAFFDEYLDLRHINLVRYFQPDFQPCVRIKAEDLQQVITNMLINADQAFAEQSANGETRTAPKKIEVRVVTGADPRSLVMRVRDNGPGIADRNRSRIFDDDFTTKSDGTGAGLAYSRRVIRLAGGTLELEQTTDSGASFKIYLPTVERGTH